MVNIDLIMAYENGELSDGQIVDMFQSMIDDGSVWTLQGSYQRMAKALIHNHMCWDTLGNDTRASEAQNGV